MAKKVVAKSTSKNEKDLEVVEAVENEELQEEEVEVNEPQEKEEPVAEVEVEVQEASTNEGAKVKIIVNRKLDSYIGDRFYRFEVGQEYLVPKNVKNILKSAGYLEAI